MSLVFCMNMRKFMPFIVIEIQADHNSIKHADSGRDEPRLRSAGAIVTNNFTEWRDVYWKGCREAQGQPLGRVAQQPMAVLCLIVNSFTWCKYT